MALSTIKKRADFLLVRGGYRASVASFLIEAKARSKDTTVGPEARFGFTVTKKLGPAVKRNRIRRRIKAAIAEVKDPFELAGFDYVVVARSAAFERTFALIRDDAVKALTLIQKLSATPPQTQKSKGKSVSKAEKDTKNATP